MNPTEYLESIGIDIFLKGHNSYKLASAGFMDLTVETWQTTHSCNNIPQGLTTNVSMCHYGEQNGDLMKDPDILFVVKDGKIEYKEFQNDYANYYSEDHEDTKRFMEDTWLPNLLSQGHKLTEREIEN